MQPWQSELLRRIALGELSPDDPDVLQALRADEGMARELEGMLALRESTGRAKGRSQARRTAWGTGLLVLGLLALGWLAWSRG